MLIQIIISLFALFALSRILVKFRKRDLKWLEFVMWLLFWLTVGVVVWVPEITNKAANVLGIGRGADLILYVSVVVVFYLIFRIYVRLEKMERNITKVVRKDALEKKIICFISSS